MNNLTTVGDFKKELGQPLKKHVNKLLKHFNLYQVEVDQELLWQTYLQSYPEEIRQEFNCNCCKKFIRSYGNLVFLNGTKIISIWDLKVKDAIYQKVLDNLAKVIRDCKIKYPFFTSRRLELGVETTYYPKTWNHFYLEVPSKYYSNDPNHNRSEAVKDAKIFKRALDEITIEATKTVLELINSNSIYRGAEYKNLLTSFLNHQEEYQTLNELEKVNYSFLISAGSLARLKNTAIGTLLVDISTGIDLDRAVNSFESIMAPTNYKRPKAIFTQEMLKNAQEQLKQAGLLNSLNRRFATSTDLTVNNVIYVDRNTKLATSNIFDELKEDIVVNPKSYSKVETISLEQFINNVLPTLNKVEVLFENKQENNLVSLIAPVDMDAPSLFKWDNGFSWTYKNSLADSLKEKVKAAGGNTEGTLRISLEWFNNDDLDLYVLEPANNHIYFANKYSHRTKGCLDVDMHVNPPFVPCPVENIIYPHSLPSMNGEYIVLVKNFTNRQGNINTGFNVEIECGDDLHTFSVGENPKNKDYLEIATFSYSQRKGIKIINSISNTTESKVNSRKIWELETNKFHKVNTICFSPNYWEKEIGNKHIFFMVEGVKNTDENIKGFYNEFLKEELDSYRRVMEAISNKLEVQRSDNELSGLGFSTTSHTEVTLRVTGQTTRVLKVSI